jgi:hypothetical protein
MFTKDSLLVAMVAWSAFGLLLSAPSVFTLAIFVAFLLYAFFDANKRDEAFGVVDIFFALAFLGIHLFALFLLVYACLHGGKLEQKRKRLPPPPPAYCKVLVHVDAGISSKELGWCEWSDVRSLSEGLDKASGRVLIIAHGRRENHYIVGEGWTTPRWVIGGVDARVFSESAGIRGLEIGVMACRGEKNPTGLDRLRIHPLWEEDLGVWVWSRKGEKVLLDEETLEKSVDFFFRD